jgi:hypothetical protein
MRKTDAPKSKAHVAATGPRFDWGAEVVPNVPGDAQTPLGTAEQYAEWTELFRAGCRRCLDVGSYIHTTHGTGFESYFVGVDRAGRPVRQYRFVVTTLVTGRERIDSISPVDPTGAVLIGKRACGDPLHDVQRETGCTRAFLCGFIDGFDNLHLARKAELVDHPDFIAGLEAGETLLAEYVRRAPAVAW